MDVDPAAANHINRLEHASPNEQATKLPLLFEKILDPDQEPRLTYSYVVGTHRWLLPTPHSELTRPPRFLSEGFSPVKDRR